MPLTGSVQQPLAAALWTVAADLRLPLELCDNKDSTYSGTSHACNPASKSINLLIAALIHSGADDFIHHTEAL